MESILSGIGVLDKSLRLVDLISQQPRTLNDLIEASGYSRATTHRLVQALVLHGVLYRGVDAKFRLGARLLALGQLAGRDFPLASLAESTLESLRDGTGESVQLYVQQGSSRVCVAALESPHGLRTIVPVGAVLPLDQGSAGRVLTTELGDHEAWVETVGEREPGVASVSAPVVDAAQQVIAALSVSGPIDRMGTSPGEKFGDQVVQNAVALSELLH